MHLKIYFSCTSVSCKSNLYERKNMRIEEIASNSKYRNNEQSQNLTIFWESS